MIETCRLDDLLISKGLAETKREAQALVRLGKVQVRGRPALKPGQKLPESSEVSVQPLEKRFVSRGGDKIWPVLQAWQWEVQDKVAVDVGAGTGGFTECLLQMGARRVYALDVGTKQLHWKLRQDPRVVSMEGVNVRYSTGQDLPELCDIATMDVSFISGLKVLPGVLSMTHPSADLGILIKPQFEASARLVGRGGVIRDPKIVRDVLSDFLQVACQGGVMTLVRLTPAAIPGVKGNREFFAWFKKGESLEGLDILEGVESAVSAAWGDQRV